MKTFYLTLFIIVAPAVLFAQSFADKINIQIGTAVNGDSDLNAGALSLAVHPSISIYKSFQLDFRVDYHIAQLSNNRRIRSSSFAYVERESYIRNLLSFQLIPNLRTNVFKIPSSIGLGLGYAQRTTNYELKKSIEGDHLIDIGPRTAKASLLWSFMASAYFDRIQTGLIYTSYENPELLGFAFNSGTIFINYRLIGKGPVHTKLNQQLQGSTPRLPLVSIESGIQAMSNLGQYAGAFNAYLAIKYALNDQLSLGFRVNSKNPKAVGYDKNPAHYFSLNNNFINWVNTQTIQKVYARLFIADYYIPRQKGWYTLHAGLGQYQRKSSPSVEGFDINQMEFFIPEIPHKRNIGGLIGVGFKTGIHQFSLEYNFTGKQIPDYLSVQMGLSLHLGKRD